MTSFDHLAERYLGEPGVAEGQMFGMPVLKVGRKVFAGWSDGRLLVKLPADRVAELIAAGEGTAFEPRPGRQSRNWVLVRDEVLAGEALGYVRGS